ncbi:MAG TPA: HAD-IIA family hydrolase [Acidimicrobiales bacterium]|nr:HAD-IIA family hydrolase [Acidimicrobiales bacterium]
MPISAGPVWVVDLDGVIWLADRPIPKGDEAVARARDRGVRLLFVTNNSSLTVGQYVEKLQGMGIDVPPDDIVTSAQAAAGLLEPGSSAVVCGGAGVTEALEQRGIETRAEGPADALVMGWHRDFDFSRLTVACRAVWAGSRFVATNRDATYPTPDGLLPGAGALVAAVAFATGAEPVVAGKPNPPVSALLLARAGGRVDLVVGDRLDTDGLLARRLDVPFGLVLSGVTRQQPEDGDVEPVHVAPDFNGLVAALDG